MFGGEGVTAQEKWVMTIRNMQQVSVNYRLLCRERKLKMGRGPRHPRLMKWLEAVEAAYAALRSRKGKSAARARKDWLIARTIEIMVFSSDRNLNMRTDLTGPRALTRQYVDSLAEAAVLAIEAEAEKRGLLG